MNAMNEDKRDERLAGLLSGMLGGGEERGNVLRLSPEQQLRRRWPLAVAAAAVVTLLAMLVAAAAFYRRPTPPAEAGHATRAVVQPVPGAAPPPKAFVAIAPPPPTIAPVRHRSIVHRRAEPRRMVARPPRFEPWAREFAPPEEAYGPYPAAPLGREALRRVLVEDRRRTRELNNRELDYLEGP